MLPARLSVALTMTPAWDLHECLDVWGELGLPAIGLTRASFEAGTPGEFTGHLLTVLNRLSELGVIVFAAAGNDATSRRFYPAAFAELAAGIGPQVVSVGALNPNSTRALFSNEAPWVRAWATGAGVVSTFPIDVQGSMTAGFAPARSSSRSSAWLTRRRWSPRTRRSA